LEVFEFTALTGNLLLLLFKLARMILLSVVLSLHLIAYRSATERTERTTNQRPSPRMINRVPNQRTGTSTECTTSEGCSFSLSHWGSAAA
jgi:hypothetical protein